MSGNNGTIHGLGTGAGSEFGPGYVLGGNYELAHPIGRGGMGQVWQARDRAGRRDVAVKMLPPELRSQEEAIDQVRESFQKTHALTHQHIGKTLAMLDDPVAGPFIVMDLISGVPLSRYAWQHRQSSGALPLTHIVELLRPVALALDYAHQEGVLHQDVKPQNVLVQIGPPLKVSLIDFGIAASIRVSMTRYTNVSPDTAGTRPYMAPERLRGKKKEWDGRSDQYALGAMAYELLSGDPPFIQDGDDFSFMYAVLNEPVDPVESLPDAVNAALQRSLAKTRDARFSSCLEFVQALAAPPVATPSAKPATPAAPPIATAVNPPISSPPPAVSTPTPSASTSSASRPSVPRQSLTRLVAPFDSRSAAAGQASCARELGVPVEFTNAVGMRFRLIPPGEFSMGGDQHDSEKPIHRVTLTQPFYLGVFPVTQGEYEHVMGDNPSCFKGDPRLPVEQVSWNDAQAFIQRLSMKEPTLTYRLPTEAQWEYACRAGTTTAFWFGGVLNGDRANVDGNHPFGTTKKGPYRKKTTPVDMFAANPFGLHDVHGNVWEWCQDWYGGYESVAVTDPAGPPGGSCRVYRGGGWVSVAANCRAASRYMVDPTFCWNYLGFRLALSFVGVPGESSQDKKK